MDGPNPERDPRGGEEPLAPAPADNPEIQTYTGARVPLKCPSIGDIGMLDIAHALSQLCRYNGHTKRFFSVAEHSYYASLIGELIATRSGLPVVPCAQLALLHDGAEAYLGDISRPLKGLISGYEELSDRFDAAIAIAFGLRRTPEILRVADEADRVLAQAEGMQVLSLQFLPMKAHEDPEEARELFGAQELPHWKPCDAEMFFLERARTLGLIGEIPQPAKTTAIAKRTRRGCVRTRRRRA